MMSEIIENDQKPLMNYVPSLLKRFVAYLIDVIILFLIGSILLFIFKPIFLKVGDIGVFFGYTIFVLYHGGMNSVIFKGQTIGKRIRKIKVVKTNGDYLSIPISLFRSLILGIPWFLNGISFSNDNLLIRIILVIVSFLLFYTIILIPFIYLFNKKTRQSLHDILFKSCVVDEKAEENPLSNEITNKGFQILMIVWGILLIIILFLFSLKSDEGKHDFKIMNDIRNELMEDNRIRNVTIQENTVKKAGENNKDTKNLNISIYYNGNIDTRFEIEDYLEVTLNNFSIYISDFDNINIVHISSVNLGIASFNRKYSERMDL